MPATPRADRWLTSIIREGWDGIRKRDLAPVAVAVLDSGVDGSHPDLAGRIAQAFVVDVVDKEAVVREIPANANNDAFGHGTCVAGVVAAVAPNAVIFDLRVLGAKHSEAAKVLLRGFRHALGEPWKVINMSLAASASMRREMIELCEQAYFQQQILVAARRNVPFEDDGIPASLSSCIGVDRGNYETPYDYIFRPRTPVEFEARGESITAPARGGGYTTLTGTSFATPAVSGLCALLLGAYPELTLFEVKTILRELSRPQN